MVWLKKHFSILFSPTFWGLTFAGLFKLAALKGWSDEATLNIAFEWLVGVTGVNIVWKFANKINTSK